MRLRVLAPGSALGPCGRAVLTVGLALLSFGLPAAAQPAPDRARTWATTVAPTPLHGAPDDASAQFAVLRASAALQILDFEGDWTYVYNPRTRGTAYVHSDLLGPSDPPSAYVFKEPPPAQEELTETAWITADTPLAYYPTPDAAAVATHLDPGTTVAIDAVVQGEDGARWYRTHDGDYLPAAAVFVASDPEQFAGHWLDVNLQVPTSIVAYEGDTPVRSMLAIKGIGRLATPTGVFTIRRRVANETMDSATLGVPRNAPGGYYLKNVLFTQYFTDDGASLHYNWWSSNFGYPGSHGCLGLSYADSAWLWNWATIGTPLSIHN